MNAPRHIDPDARWIDGSLWEFRTARYTVALFAEEEDLDPADSFTNERDIAFASDGDPAHWFMAVVAIYDQEGDQIACDVLGGCSYNSFREFYSAHRWQYQRAGARPGKWLHSRRDKGWKPYHGSGGTYFVDMVRQAVREARAIATRSTMCAAED